jgi:hypothetical protein
MSGRSASAQRARPLQRGTGGTGRRHCPFSRATLLAKVNQQLIINPGDGPG